MEFPISIQKKFIKRGSILHSDIFDEIDHGKFFVIIGISKNTIAGFFFINSRIHPTIMSRQAQLDMQFQLKHKDYDFLKYDSFLSATVIKKISTEDLVHSINSGHTNYVGDLTESDLNCILSSCRTSNLFKESEKRDFFYEEKSLHTFN